MESDQKYLPPNPTVEQQNLIKQELKYWQITGLDYKLATSANFLRVEKMLNKSPDISYCDALENWADWGPLSINDIIEKSGFDYEDFTRANMKIEERDLNQLKNTKHKNVMHTEFSMLDQNSHNKWGI